MFTSGLSITKILSGLSNTLKIANQIIPIYKEIKPTISSAKTLINTFQKKQQEKPKMNTSNNVLNQEKDTFSNESVTNNYPIFFN